MEDIVSKLKEFFRGRDDIVLAFLFGSAAFGMSSEESDVDIAVLAEVGFDLPSFLKLKADLSEILEKDADIVVLNDASPIITMQVIQKGVLLKAKENSSYPKFFVKSLEEYEDLKYFRIEAERNILQGTGNG